MTVSPHQAPNRTLSLAVLSGKGGVGKTGFALNLGCALHRLNQPVLLVDCDMGLANLDVLLGISPQHNLQDLIVSDLDAETVLCEVEPGGLDLLPAASGLADLIEMDEDAREVLMGKLNRHFGSYDYLLLDLPAGISDTVLSLARMARSRIIVLTPEPTSLTDSYALIKVLHGRWGVKRFQVVVNMAESAQEAQETFEKLNSVCLGFLGFATDWLGFVHSSPVVRESVRQQTPFVQSEPQSQPARDIQAIARTISKRRQTLLPEISSTPVLSALG